MRSTTTVAALVALSLSAPVAAQDCPANLQKLDASLSHPQATGFCRCTQQGQAAALEEGNRDLLQREPSFTEGRRADEISSASWERAAHLAQQAMERLFRRCATESGIDGDRLLSELKAKARQ
jgi:hypothetical protein